MFLFSRKSSYSFLLIRHGSRYFSDKTNANPGENKLMKQIKARILASGPITVADYMREVLTNPSAGYYMNRDVFGEKGDFITSPEISQTFGELIAVWFYNEWSKVGKPKPLQITELGPGRGTLMADILRVFSKFNLHGSDLSVSLVEVSPYLSKVQKQKLCANPQVDEGEVFSKSLYGSPVCWYNSISDLPKSLFTLYLAHEFFDALPINKLVRVEGNKWREVLIDLNPSTETLRYVLSRDRTPACLYRRDNESRKELEVSPQSLVTVQEMSCRIHQDGGIGLIIDYGHEGEKTDTFRGFKNHQLHDPLIDPGTADLTADVDFSALKWAATERPIRGSQATLTFGTVTQAQFLSQMGIDVRLEQLLAKCAGDEVAATLKSAHRMLVDPAEMGGKFKMMALYPAILKPFLLRYPPHGFS